MIGIEKMMCFIVFSSQLISEFDLLIKQFIFILLIKHTFEIYESLNKEQA